MRRLDEIFSRFDELAEQLGLEKIKTIGDAYMVCGGVPRRARRSRRGGLRDGAPHARAVDGARDAMGGELRVRIGVHTGPVVAGVIGKKKFIYDVWGDTVNTRAGWSRTASPARSRSARRPTSATKDVFDFEPRGTIEVKGKGEMKTYFLLGRRPAEGRDARVRSQARASAQRLSGGVSASSAQRVAFGKCRARPYMRG